MRNTFLWMAVLCALAFSVACGGKKEEAPAPSAEPAATGAATTGSGSITGSVTYNGPDPDTTIPMNADAFCAGAHTTPVTTEKVVAADGKLANVFVYVKSGLAGGSYPAPSEKKEIDQHGCMYSPHVQGIQIGQTLVVKNSDATLHNIHGLPTQNPEFNQAQPVQGMSFEKTFEKPEVMVHFKCDVHPWMSSYLGVVENPFYAVSGADGTFNIANLPAGTYTVEAWQEELGTMTGEVTVTDGQPATLNFDFKPKAPAA